MATRRKEFAVCVRNEGYEVSLERRKIYEVLPDPEAAKCKQIRIVDESGEDYLYLATYFASIELPQRLRKALLAGAGHGVSRIPRLQPQAGRDVKAQVAAQRRPGI